MKSYKAFFFVIVAIALHLFVLSQLRFEVWPEMLLMPYLMHHGFELYRDMIVPWTPGLMWLLSLWFVFLGLSVGKLKILTWIVIGSIDLLLYRIANKKFGETAAIVSLIFFVLLQPLFDGNGLWFDLVTTPLLLVAFETENLLLLSAAFLVKQSVIWVFPVFWKQWKKLFFVFASSIVGTALWFLLRGTLKDYIFWAYNYTFLVFSRMPGHADFGSWRLWAFSLFPFLLIVSLKLLSTHRFREETTSKNPLLWALLLISFALPRFGLFHFQPAIAFLALSFGELYKNYKRLKKHKAYIPLGVMAIYLVSFWQRAIVIQWRKTDRFLEPEVYQIAAKTALTTNEALPVLLVNGPELAYVLSNRLPPKPWFTQFPWFLELPGFQEQMIQKFKSQNLHQIFFTPYQHEGTFTPGSYQPKSFLEYLRTASNDSND